METLKDHANGALAKIVLSGPTNVYIGGDLTTAVNAAGTEDIDINGDVLLTANTTLDATASDGTIDFSGKIDSSSATNHTLTLKAGTGTIKINGVIGSTNDIGNLAINDDLTGSGAITLSGIGASGKDGVTGTVDIGHTSTGSVTLNGSLYRINGATTITSTTGADKIDVGEDLTIQTDGDDLHFVGGDVKLSKSNLGGLQLKVLLPL